MSTKDIWDWDEGGDWAPAERRDVVSGDRGVTKVRIEGIDADGVTRSEIVTLDGTTPVQTKFSYQRGTYPPPGEDRHRLCWCGERKPCNVHSEFKVGDG